MRIENGYLQQSMLCSKNNRNAVGNFSDTMNKAQEDVYKRKFSYNAFFIY